MKKEEKKLIFVLSLFVIAMSIILIIKNNYYSKSQEAILFESSSFISAENESQISGSSSANALVKFPIDINLATKEQLMEINGIGEKTATKIIELRQKNGCFKSMTELLNVDGIGEKTLLNLRKYLFIANEQTNGTNIANGQTPNKNNPETTKKATENSQGANKSIKYPLDINFATFDELVSLAGIGETKANDIISYRINTGFFYSINEIKNVSGIGEGIFSGIKSYICVDINKLPPKTEVTATTSTSKITVTTKVVTALVNINTATIDELLTLPKMNTTIAQQIIDHRSHPNCQFVNIMELEMFISNDEIYKAIEKYITLK